MRLVLSGSLKTRIHVTMAPRTLYLLAISSVYFILSAFLLHATGGHTNFTLGVFVPLAGNTQMEIKVRDVLKWTVLRINENPSFTELRHRGYYFGYNLTDDKCDKSTGLIRFVELVAQKKNTPADIDVVIGNSFIYLFENLCSVLCSTDVMGVQWRGTRKIKWVYMDKFWKRNTFWKH